MNSSRELRQDERDKVLAFFSGSRYMFGLTRGEFDVIAARSVGEALCARDDLPVVDAFRKYIQEDGHPVETLNLLAGCIEECKRRSVERLKTDGEYAAGLEACTTILANAAGTGQVVLPRSLLVEDMSVSHVKRALNLALDAALNGRFEDAFTNARAAIEGTLKFVLTSRGVVIPRTVELTALWGEFKKSISLPYGRGVSDQQNDLVNGIGKILTSVNSVRNNLGSAHGKAESVELIGETNVRLFVNAAATFCDYVLSVWREGGARCL